MSEFNFEERMEKIRKEMELRDIEKARFQGKGYNQRSNRNIPSSVQRASTTSPETKPPEFIKTHYTELLSRFIRWSIATEVKPDYEFDFVHRPAVTKFKHGLLCRLNIGGPGPEGCKLITVEPAQMEKLRAWRLTTPTIYSWEPRRIPEVDYYSNSDFNNVFKSSEPRYESSSGSLTFNAAATDCSQFGILINSSVPEDVTGLSSATQDVIGKFTDFNVENRSIIYEVSTRVTPDMILDQVATIALTNGIKTDNF